MGRLVVRRADEVFGVVLLQLGQEERPIAGQSAIMGVIDAEVPEYFDAMPVAPVHHYLDRVQADRQILLHRVVFEKVRPRGKGAEDLAVVEGVAEAQGVAVEDAVHLAAQERRGAQGQERFGGEFLLVVDDVVAIVVENHAPRALGGFTAQLAQFGEADPRRRLGVAWSALAWGESHGGKTAQEPGCQPGGGE